MARLAHRASGEDHVAERFLEGPFMRIMAEHAEAAGTPNPATRAAVDLRSGAAVDVRGDWIGPEFSALIVRLQIGRPVVVVGHDD